MYSKAIAAFVGVAGMVVGREYTPAESQVLVDFFIGVGTVGAVYFFPNKERTGLKGD
jgi:hypothetical protein